MRAHVRGCLALALAAIAACAPARSDETASVQSAVRMGAPTMSDPAVAALVLRRLACGATPPGAYCTGTLIAPRVLLTAAHCLEERRPGDLGVFFGADVGGAGTTLAVIAMHVHPAFDPATGDHDLALLVLETASAVPPVVLANTPPGAGFVGSTVRVVGFGVDENGKAGTARSGLAKVSSLDVASFRYVANPAMTCGGDSGGPVFFDDGTGEKVVGVTRSGDADCVQYGTALRIDDELAGFVAPVVASAPIDTAVSLDPAKDYCAAPCVADSDCPLAMVCLSERGLGMRCGFPGLESGRFGAACSDDTSCGAGACVAILAGGGGSCRCFSPCNGLAAPPSTPPPAELTGGCRASAPPVPPAARWVALVGALALGLGRLTSRRGRSASRPRDR